VPRSSRWLALGQGTIRYSALSSKHYMWRPEYLQHYMRRPEYLQLPSVPRRGRSVSSRRGYRRQLGLAAPLREELFASRLYSGLERDVPVEKHLYCLPKKAG
jgi:hypothetical protein